MNYSSLKRGKVYIFNINKFKTAPEDERLGSEKDVESIKTTFGQMNTLVHEPFIDVTKSEIKHQMQEIKHTDFTDFDYVAIVFSSHGDEDSIAMTTDMEFIYLLRTFMVPMFKNRTLSKKLKWLITQTCRGVYDLSTEAPVGQEAEVQLPFNDPRYYLISYGTSEGYLSRRCPATGSIYIQSLCKELSEHYHNEDILRILSRVSTRVRNMSNELKADQLPAIEENFGGAFKFSFFNQTSE